jgi:biotin carboxyl carrier protein
VRSYRVSVDGDNIEIGIDQSGQLSIEGKTVEADIRQLGASQYSALIDGRSFTLMVTGTSGKFQVLHGSLSHEVVVETERERLMQAYNRTAKTAAPRTEIRAPMPALVIRIEVSVGEKVEPGMGLMVLEAMKMENELKSHVAGTVREIHATQGKPVEKGELLLVLE